jgi:spore maturation protein B
VNSLLAAVVPLILVGVPGWAALRGADVFKALTDGAAQGLSLFKTLAPTLVALMTGITMLRASGALDAAAQLLRPLTAALGIPAECTPLLLLRPVSGSGALAVGAEIMKNFGADSLVGRTAAVMLGSSETTFYTIGVYFGATGVARGRHVLVCALLADLTVFLVAGWAARVL